MLSEYDHQIRRERMVREVIAAPCEIERIAVRDQAVLKALCSVPRHHFVSPELAGRSYEDESPIDESWLYQCKHESGRWLSGMEMVPSSSRL